MRNLFSAALIFALFNIGAAFALTAPNSTGFRSPAVWTVADDAGREGISATTPGSSDPGNVAGTNNHSENPLNNSAGTGTTTSTAPTPDANATTRSDTTEKSGTTTN